MTEKISPDEIGKTIGEACRLLGVRQRIEKWAKRYGSDQFPLEIGCWMEYKPEYVSAGRKSGPFVIYKIRDDGRVFGTGVTNDHDGYVDVELMQPVNRQAWVEKHFGKGKE